jgi:hypothetical protein
MLLDIQKGIRSDFITDLATGTGTATGVGLQAALANAWGGLQVAFEDEDIAPVYIINPQDVADYLGTANITVQTAFGFSYVENFLGYKTLFLLSAPQIPQGTVIATPVENIDLYYVDPADSDFAKLGLVYRTDGETNLVGFHANGNYGTAVGESFALMGITLWAEYIDGIAVYTVGEENSQNAGGNSENTGA